MVDGGWMGVGSGMGGSGGPRSPGETEKKLRQKLSRLKFVYPFFRFAQAAKKCCPTRRRRRRRRPVCVFFFKKRKKSFLLRQQKKREITKRWVGLVVVVRTGGDEESFE